MLEVEALSTPPAQKELYYLADFLELLCMTDPERSFSADRLSNLLEFSADFGSLSKDALDGDLADVVDQLSGVVVEPDALDLFPSAAPEDVDRGSVEDEEDDEALPHFGREAELSEERVVWCRNLFALLARRERSLSADYPFRVERELMRIKFVEPASASGRLYLFYLACSTLNYSTAATRSRLTKSFERVSKQVQERLTPNFNVEIFGTSEEGRFAGGAFDKLEALARELETTVMATRSEFHPSDSGDHGLDIVAWYAFNDSAGAVPAYFGQCACGKKWDGKQYEASPMRWRQLLHLKVDPQVVIYIPHYFRGSGDDWYAPSDVSTVLIDRLRAVRLGSEITLQSDAASLVDELLRVRRALV
ncbi:hypothetical protein [Cellulomonas endophytica]|uniref:hypothetical protein n=1 Tax=Cellulomonas endophytica TaxID=2494735 RepID=UPI001011C100|nr:hypothetical protein [Cellulomonas endophytica]